MVRDVETRERLRMKANERKWRSLRQRRFYNFEAPGKDFKYITLINKKIININYYITLCAYYIIFYIFI